MSYMKVPCVCIDASNRPSEVLPHNWINDGTKYHITHVYYHTQQGINGVELLEVRTKSTKYNAYKLSRFAFTKEGFQQLIELMKAMTELSKVDIETLLEECELQTVEDNTL